MRRTPRPATTLITDVGGSVLLLTVVTLILAPSTSAQVGCNQSNTGQSFIVAFTQSPQSPTKTLTLFVGSTANPIRVTVTYSNSSSSTSDAGAFNHTAIQIPADMELSGSGGIESKAIQVTTNDTATVVGLTEQGNYSEAYLALPLSALGRQYFTAGYAPQGGDAARVIYLSQFAIAATTDATNVTVTLSGMFTGVLYFRLVNYTAGQKINFLLNRFQAVQFQSTADLTGSEVTANNQVAVWAGNLAARLDGSTENHVVEQMLPVWASGTSFAVGSLSGNYPYAVKVVAVSPATSITYVEQISSSQSPNIVSQTLARSGDYLTIYEPSRGIVISASGTLIVCQMTNQTSSPAMAVVPPVSGFLAQYRFVVPTKTLREFNVFSTVLVNSAYQSQLIYDASFNLGTLAWTNVPGSVYNVSQVPTSHLVNAVRRIDGPTRFSVTVQGSSSGQPLTSYFYPAGFCLLPLAVSNTGPSQAASDTTSQIVLKSTALRSSSYTTGSTVISTLTTTTTGPVVRNSTQPISSNTIPSAISSPTTTTTTTTLISSHTTTPSSTRKTPLPIVPGNDNQASASDTTRRTTPFTTITTTSSTAGVSLRTTPFSISTLPTSTSTTTSQTSSSTTSSGISLRTTPFTSSTTSASVISGRTTPLSSSTTVSSGISGRTTPLFSSATSASSASSSSSIRLIRTTPPFVSSSTTLSMPSTLPTSGPTLISSSSSSTTLPSSSPLTSGPPLSSSTALPASTTLPTSGQTLLSSPTATSFTPGPPATLSSTTSSPGTATTLPSALSTSGVSPLSSLVPPSFSPPLSTLIPASFSTSLTPGPPISSSLTPGPPVSSSLTPGPPLSSSLTPGPPVSSSLTPGPPVLSSSTPGPPVSSSLTPGPPISSSLTPGPPLSSSLTPGPPVSLSLTPGPPVSSSLTPGPPVLSSSTPGPPVSSSLTPGPPMSSSLTPGPPLTSSLTPGPPVSSSQTAVSFTPGPPATLLSTTSLSGTATTLPSSQPTSGVLPPFLSSGLPSSSSSPTSIPTALSTATGLSTTSTSSSTASPSLTPGPPSPSLSSSSATPGLPPSSTPTAGPPLLSSATSGLPASLSLPTTSGPITGIPTAGIVFPVSIRRSVPGTDVVIQMVNPGSDPVQVIIRYSGSDYPFVIPGRNETSWTVPRSSNAVMDAETVLITASGPIVVTVLQIGSCSAYLPLPIAALGTEYQIITWNTSSWFYLTSEQQAIVRITFPQGSCRIRSGNLTFFCGDDFALDLSPGSTVIFTSTSDLSGAYIRSDSPVSVLAGNTNTTTIGTGNIADSAATTLFPVYAWGLNFAVAPVPNNDGFGYSLKIGSGRGSATVTIYTDSTRAYSLSSGGIITVNVASNQPAYVTSNVPIQVVQFVNSANAGGGASGAPASLSIPSRERYTKSYVFGSVSRFMNYIVVVIDGGSASGFRLNDQPTTSDGWRTVPGSTLVTRAFPIAAGAPSGSVAHPTQNFGAFRFSYIANDATYGTCELAYTAGALLPVQQVSSSTVATTFPTLATSFPTQPTPPPSSGRNLLVRDCSCLNISSELQPLYDGYYYALNDTLNGQPVYKRQDCDVYLFLYLGSASYWVVGPRPGTNRGVLLNSAIFQAAAEAQRWEGYNTTENAFEPEPSFAASCSCPATSCRSVEVVNDDGESVFNGVFFFIYTTFNGRPVFRHEDGNLFLYYQVTGTCQRWVVSSSIGGQAAVLYANDRSADVAAIPPSTVWRYFRGAGFVDEPDIELRCYPASSGVPS